MEKKRKKPREGRDFEELLERLRFCGSAKEARAIHKELRKYGDGIPLYDRYPNLPIWVSSAALVFAIVSMIVKTAY